MLRTNGLGTAPIRADRRHARDEVIALPTPFWAATEDMDFVWYFADVVLSASFA
jgi:hypothetical protein